MFPWVWTTNEEREKIINWQSEARDGVVLDDLLILLIYYYKATERTGRET